MRKAASDATRARRRRRVHGGTTWLMASAMLALPLFNANFTARGRQAEAQDSLPTLTVSTEIQVEPMAPTPVGLQLSSAHPLPPQVLLVIRGLPATVSFSEGRAFGPGVWAVPASSVDALKVTAMAGVRSDSQVSFSLVSLDGETLAEVKSVLRIGPSSPGARAVALTAAPLPDASAREELAPRRATGVSLRPALSPEEEERAVKLVQKGDESLQSGAITVARLFYRRAAEVGLARGALSLAGTYDAFELVQTKVVGGVQPDAEQARKWYKRAMELGAAEAPERLRRLGLK